MHLQLNSEASSTLRVKQYNHFKSAMKNILLGSAWLVHIPMGHYGPMGFNNPNPLDFTTEAQRQTHRPQSPGLKRSQGIPNEPLANCKQIEPMWYQLGRFLLVFQGASLWTTAVRKTRNLIGLCSAESLDTTKKSKKNTSEHLEICCTSPGSFCFLNKLLTSSLQQTVHSWNGVLNIWILTCWWIHSRASGHNPPCGDIELKSLQCAKTRWLKNMQQRRT